MRSKKAMTWSITALTGILLLIIVLFWPAFPWSGQLRYTLRRTVVKAQAAFAARQNGEPKLVSLTGQLSGSGAFSQALKGAQIVATESASGYAAMTDSEGKFMLPHLLWYPGATYNLTITADIYHVRHFKVATPPAYPGNGIVDVGQLNLQEGYIVQRNNRPISYLKYDGENDDYYRGLFNRLTEHAITDHQKIDAINKYIATKLNPKEDAWSFNSAREIIERGAPHCSNLSFAMAIIVAAGGYPARTVHTIDTIDYLNTHVSVEVFFGDRWHLYDPTYGIFFLDGMGRVASYKDLRLNPDLITPAAFQGFDPRTIRSILEWMPKAAGSGFHQIYEINKNEICIVW
ncbi:MAG TPA: transglutaminase domain-containing protein [Blastocatellia bacterium]|nr:transglutaminase domain-containing protein [Blastocatellia bacterium]